MRVVDINNNGLTRKLGRCVRNINIYIKIKAIKDEEIFVERKQFFIIII